MLYNWQQLLAGEALSSLGIDSTSDICVEFEDPLAAKPEWDHRAIQGQLYQQSLLVVTLVLTLTTVFVQPKPHELG